VLQTSFSHFKAYQLHNREYAQGKAKERSRDENFQPENIAPLLAVNGRHRMEIPHHPGTKIARFKK
jgi:hypothetical protein